MADEESGSAASFVRHLLPLLLLFLLPFSDRLEAYRSSPNANPRRREKNRALQQVVVCWNAASRVVCGAPWRSPLAAYRGRAHGDASGPSAPPVSAGRCNPRVSESPLSRL